jgi:hypothetical protein
MQRPTPRDCQTLGIERIATIEYLPVVRVDVITRNENHAAQLEHEFGTRAFRLEQPGGTLHAFSRLPAARAKEWFESRGIAFALRKDGMRPDGPETWIPSGHLKGAGTPVLT